MNQLDNFVDNLEDKSLFRRQLLVFKHAEEESLFKLEQEYLKLVRERRTSLVTFLQSSSTTKRAVSDQLKGMHDEIKAELASFLRIRVYEGWQWGQVHRLRQCLKDLGVPVSLLALAGVNGGENDNVAITQLKEMFLILLHKSI